MTVVGTIKYEYEITQEMMDDILSCAFEGGITYWHHDMLIVTEWPEGATYASEVPSRDGTVTLRPDEHPFESTDERPEFPLNKDMAVAGIQKACDRMGMTPQRLVEECDADIGDIVVQFAIFGEVVFG